MEKSLRYMTVEELYQWAKARNLEKKTIVTYDNYGELNHYIFSDEIDVTDTDELRIQNRGDLNA